MAKDDGKKPEAHMAMKRRMKGGPRKSITSLAVLARAGFEQPGTGEEATERLWPTPHGMPKPGQHRRPGPSGNELGRAVNEAEREMWPTPKASPSGPDFARANRPGSGGDDLATAVAREALPLTRDGLFTTPTADDTGHRKGKYKQGVPALSAQAGGALNPTWVEWLMGFPPEWTVLPPSATPSSRRSRSGSGSASSPTRKAA